MPVLLLSFIVVPTGDFKAELLELIEDTELTISTLQAECLLPPNFGARLVEQWNGSADERR